MTEMNRVEPQKTAGFVDRGFNHAKRRAKIEEEEAEIARLEAIQRGDIEPDAEEVEPQEEEVQAQAESTDPDPIEVKEKSEPEEDDSKLEPEERTFKKRYGDLRRHMESKEKEWNEKFESLKNSSERKGVVPPKSDEDIEEWSRNYPDVAGIVETIAAKKAQELFSKADARLQQIDKAEEEANRIKAENRIRESHSDFDDLRNSDAFHDWADEQPKWVKDALYENMDDPASVVRVIDLYKIDNGLTKDIKKATSKAAASSVGRGSRTKVDAEGSSRQIKESDVAKMSADEFEKRSDAINEAIKSGRFVYDVSGSAR